MFGYTYRYIQSTICIIQRTLYIQSSLIMVIEIIQLATFMYILFIFNNFNNMHEKCKTKYFASLKYKVFCFLSLHIFMFICCLEIEVIIPFKLYIIQCEMVQCALYTLNRCPHMSLQCT